MDAQLLRRPVSSLLSSRSQSVFTCSLPAKRHESSYRRTKKKLNIRPDASFLAGSSPPKQDHIIFNPPSAAPTFLHTPLKFLPKDDKRRELFASAKTSTIATSTGKLPPPVFKPRVGFQQHHLSQEDVKEIQRLRKNDPETWTAYKLAKKFNCSKMFVMICIPAPADKIDADRVKLEAIKARWGPKRTMAREDRAKRWEMIWKDQ